MKTIGLIGGMSWESTLEYYRILNQEAKRILGGTHSAKCLLFSFDFEYVERLQHHGKWEELTQEMVDQAKNLKKAGAEFIAICTNTMHLMAPDIEQNTNLNVLHIADAAGEEIQKQGLKKVGLLGTKFTMESTFYSDRLKENYDIDVIIPNDSERQIVHDTIYKELILGEIKDSSRNKFLRIIENLVKDGAEGIVLGCTEIPLLVKQQHTNTPIFDTTTIHAKAILKHALKGNDDTTD